MTRSALLAFAAGLLVPEATVRTALAASLSGIQLAVERDALPGAAPEDVGVGPPQPQSMASSPTASCSADIGLTLARHTG
jgi:hypothetical protein